MTVPGLKRFRPPPRDMAEDAFIDRFGGVYEHSPWIAETAYRRGLTQAEDVPSALAVLMAAVVSSADRNAQLALIRAHPDLAGRAAIAGELTQASKDEQAGSGLDRCTPEEFRRFQDLNEAYKRKFGFPFVLAVAGRGRAEILQNFALRLDNNSEEEFAEALRQVDKIAALRLALLAT